MKINTNNSDNEELRRSLLDDAYALAFTGTPAALLDVDEIVKEMKSMREQFCKF